MDEHELIEQCKSLLDNADGCLAADDHDGYCARMYELQSLLIDELVGSVPEQCESSESSDSRETL